GFDQPPVRKPDRTRFASRRPAFRSAREQPVLLIAAAIAHTHPDFLPRPSNYRVVMTSSPRDVRGPLRITLATFIQPGGEGKCTPCSSTLRNTHRRGPSTARRVGCTATMDCLQAAIP